MASRSKARGFVPRDYLPDSPPTTITFNDDTQLQGTGSVNLARRQLGFTIPAAQGNSTMTFQSLTNIFDKTSKTQRIDADYSGVTYDSMEGYMDLLGIKKVDENFYITMGFTLLSLGGGTQSESQESQDITTNIILGDSSTIRGTGMGDDRSKRLELRIPAKQGNNQRDFSWMVTTFTNTSKTSRIRPQYSETESGDFRNYTTLQEIRLDDDIYTIILTAA